ncbi:unnamed protein product [Strongylus vulgaris]|uniref:Uncharacterized protein n=1 Tax=Strongylus vulgaris TaxID=40348 RepID=A0A3P7LYL1_STRVU|nr:unnamed protein product [Strongylus vulgaris]
MSHKNMEVTAVPNGIPPHDGYKKKELNNNHLPMKKPVGTPPSNLFKMTAVPNGIPPHDGYKKKELNNNHLPMKKPVGTPPSNLFKAKSEGSLNEEVENSPPVNYDDMPIKPAKGGQYYDIEEGRFFLKLKKLPGLLIAFFINKIYGCFIRNFRIFNFTVAG